MQNKYTIEDIARDLGVSCATVSRVLNNKPGVGAKLRQKVLDYMKEVDYTPSSLAQGMTKGRINVIALIFGDVRNPFYADLLFHIQQELETAGYVVVACNSGYNAKKEIEYLNMACRFLFSGVIMISAQTQEIVESIEKAEIPVVLVNRFAKDYKGSYVSVDNFQAGYMATMHLVEKGHTNLGFVAGPMTSTAILERYRGFLQVYKNMGVAFEKEKYFFQGDLTMESGYKIAEEFWDLDGKHPSALVISNDLMAIGFIEHCHEKGINIPEKLSIVSFDNIKISELPDIALTTIDQSVEKMSCKAVELMLQQIQYPEMPAQRVIMEPKLIIRKTVSPH